MAGLLGGSLGLFAVAQEPGKPSEPAKPATTNIFAAPDNVTVAPANAEKTESGLASLVLKKGTGTQHPTESDTVRVHYTGWKASDGEMFDSSLRRGQAAEFPLNQVIRGWTEGVQLMVVGEKRRFWIPSDLAYGDEGRVAGDLTFDVELIEIVKPPEAPKELIAPTDALVSESGLKTKILKEGEGDRMPGSNDVITAHFTGWKANGEFVTTTVNQAQPAQFKLSDLKAKGWIEGVQLMKKGEKRRFWIPAELGFGKEGEAPAGAPAGDLIFDFEVIDIREIPKPPRAADAPDNVEAAPDDALKTESGIPYLVLETGEGEGSPQDGDIVAINFSVWDASGVAVGSNRQIGKPMSFNLEQSTVIGWVDLLKGMKKGEKVRAWIPEDKTFAQAGRNNPRGTLTCDLELVSFKTPPPAPETPADVAAVPADAIRLDSGLAYKVLKKGTGDKKPGPKDSVKVHYAGWTTDGNLFDNSIQRDELFEVNMRGGVIKGWLEGLKVMVEGEKTRFWIPADMAYGDTPVRPGGPSGLLVFDIELFEIQSPEAPQELPKKKGTRKKIEVVTPPIEVNPPQKSESPETK